MKLNDFSIIVSFSAAGIATSLILIFLPNIETITYTVFLVGFLYGKKNGILTGITISIGWEIVATMIMGGFSGIIFPFKIIFWAFTGFLGGVLNNKHFKLEKIIEFASIGAFLGLMYDLWVTVGIALMFLNQNAFWVIFISKLIFGAPFTVAHVIGNLILFSSMPMVIRAIIISENRIDTSQIEKMKKEQKNYEDTTR